MDRSIKSRAVVIAENLLVAAAYAISGKIGLLFPYAGDHVTLFWPPLGIAIAALLLRGLHVSPGIVVGSLAVNVSTGAGPLLASGIAIGNTAAPVLAYFLLKKESISEYYLSSPSKIISFLGIAALMAPLVSATGGVLSLSLFGGLDRSPWLTWMVWWFGDATGVLCWTPFLILLHPTLFKRSYPASKLAAFLLLLTLQITTLVILFQQGSEHSILLQQLGPVAFLLLLLVTASILPPWFSSCSIVVFSLIASVFTSLGSGPFAGYAPHIGVAICWIYISTAGVLCLIISSLLDAKSEDQTRLSTLVKNLSSALETAHVNSQIGDLYHKTMNHELRTPLTGILGMSELLDDKNLSDQQRDELSAIRSSAENLKTILDDILEFSRIEMQHVTLQPEACDLKQLFTTTLRIFEALSRPKGVQLKIDLEDLECPYVKIDRARLRQVVSNLLNNAVKFTSEGHVELRASSRLVDHDPLSVRIHCSIADTGVGIAKDLQSKIFERFVSLKPTSNQKAENGIGLGLPICRDLITLMGGNLHLDSSPDNGTRVSFSFFAPLSDESAAEESSLATPAANPTTKMQSKLRVLIAEDNEINLKLLSHLLVKMGCNITVAVNGKQAVEAFGQSDFDVVFMDIFMPVMDGLDATRAIRSSGDKGKRIPIIAVSAAVTESDQLRCRAAGIDMFIGKPFTTDDILNALTRYGRAQGSSSDESTGEETRI